MPALAVTTPAGGVQLVAAPYREDICLAAGEAIAGEVAAI